MNLQESLDQRSALLDEISGLVTDTQALYEKYGASFIVTAYDQFAKLQESLSARELRMVVVGEFSRGKSSLLNALLGIDHLPTANEATTAINTFIYGLKSPDAKPYMDITLTDQTRKTGIEIDAGKETLKKWGTELDPGNRDARRDVERIDLYLHHPLLERDLTLIDTPGLESMQAHHEEITRSAIDSAHIAIWVQNTDQLGGTKQEWAFMRDTLSRNFDRFITVVNAWDRVLNPEDEQDKRLPEAERVEKKLEKVRDNFRRTLANLPEERLQMLIAPKNLMGISAKWALTGTGEQKAKSGIKQLSDRIVEIVSGPEAREAMCATPLRNLLHQQAKLKEHLETSRAELDNAGSLDEQKRELEKLEADIKLLTADAKLAENEARIDHGRHAQTVVSEIEKDLIEPLLALRSQIAAMVTQEYIQSQIDAGKKTIGLPGSLQKEYADTMNRVGEYWNEKKANISESLEQLRLSYAERMDKYAGKLGQSLQQLNIELPQIDVNLDVNLDGMQNYYMKQLEIQQSIDSIQDKMDKMEEEAEQGRAEKAVLSEQMALAEEEMARAERMLINHGSRPAPLRATRREQVSEGGTWSDPKFEQVEYLDHSNVEQWEEANARYEELLANKEEELRKIREENARKKGKEMSMEKALQRYRQKCERYEAERDRLEKQARETAGRIGADARESIVQQTIGQIDRMVRNLTRVMKESISKLYDEQLDFLSKCVNEQLTEKLQSHEAAKREAIAVIEQGEQEQNARKKELDEALAAIEKLNTATQNLLDGQTNGY